MLERNKFFNIFEIDKTSALDVPISVAECAELSLRIYDEIPPRLPGWELISFLDDEATGYRGACYGRHLLTNNTLIIFVNRGTVINIENIISDIQIALEQVPLQCASAMELAGTVSENLKQIYKGKEDLLRFMRFVITGHSLGGVLTDCNASIGVHSITFDNPGSKQIVKKIAESRGASADMVQAYICAIKEWCHAYQAGVNVINTCNEQLGHVFAMSNLSCNYHVIGAEMPLPEKIRPIFYLNPYYLSYSLLDQHSILNIYKYLKAGGTFNLNDEHPYGFNKGYVAYLDQDLRGEYWEGYIKLCWDLYPEVQVKFMFNFERFKEDSKQQIKAVHDSIKTNPTLLPEILNDRASTISKVGIFAENKINKSSVDNIIEDFVLVENDNMDKHPNHFCTII